MCSQVRNYKTTEAQTQLEKNNKNKQTTTTNPQAPLTSIHDVLRGNDEAKTLSGSPPQLHLQAHLGGQAGPAAPRLAFGHRSQASGGRHPPKTRRTTTTSYTTTAAAPTPATTATTTACTAATAAPSAAHLVP